MNLIGGDSEKVKN